ncbi:hypothetical protein ACVWXO_003360 [Bradyrhizobium sp. LM2.7]
MREKAARTDLCGGALSNERPYRDRFARNDEENGQLVRSDREAVARCMATNSAAWNCGSGVRHGDITQYLTVERLPCWYDANFV